MPSLPAAQAIKCEYLFSTGVSRLNANILHVGYDGTPPTVAQLATFGAALDALVDVHLLTTFMSNTVEHVESKFTDLSSLSGAAVTTAPNVFGGNAGTPAPESAAAVISWNISRRYRGGKPRTYVGGLVDSLFADPRQLTGAFATNLFAGGVYYLAHMPAAWAGASNIRAVNVSYYGGAAPVVATHGRERLRSVLRAAPVLDTIVSCSVHSRIGTQRRRLGKEAT